MLVVGDFFSSSFEARRLSNDSIISTFSSRCSRAANLAWNCSCCLVSLFRSCFSAGLLLRIRPPKIQVLAAAARPIVRAVSVAPVPALEMARTEVMMMVLRQKIPVPTTLVKVDETAPPTESAIDLPRASFWLRGGVFGSSGTDREWGSIGELGIRKCFLRREDESGEGLRAVSASGVRREGEV